MANMSYCRFQNTVPDLRDCARNMREPFLSDEEAAARIELVNICIDILDGAGIYADVGERSIAECIQNAMREG